jgi:hypothetical protein
VRYLKTRKDSDALAYQRHIGKRLKSRARAMNISDPVVMSLSLQRGASDSAIASELERCNQQFETLMRFLGQTDIRAVQNAELESYAKAYVEVKGVGAGDLYGIDSLDDTWDETIDTVFGHYQHQDHPEYRKVYPDATYMPSELRDAILSILTSKDDQRKFHLFSDAIEAYQDYRKKRIDNTARSDYERAQKLSEFKKDIKRLKNFYDFSGNEEFTTESCNESLHRYRRHLLDRHSVPSTAKRYHEIACAALRWYADEYVPSVVIRQFRFMGQRQNASITPVLNLENELLPVWKAAHDPSYDHFFRLAAFGIFAGASTSELAQTFVSDVHAKQGYYVLQGSKTAHRARPAVIVNQTHERLLLKFGEGSIAGPKRSSQTGSNLSRVIKDGLVKATGNPKISAYSTRHTGKFMCDVLGRAGHFSKPMIDEMKAIVARMTQDLPDLNHLDRVALNTGNVLHMRW